MYYYILLFALIVTAILAYYLGPQDIMEPDVILLLIFIASATFAIYLFDYWRLSEYSGQTVFLFLLGLWSFAFGACLARHLRLSFGERSITISNNEHRYSRIDINPVIQLLVIVISAIILVLFVMFFRRVISEVSIANMISLYKDYRTSGDGSIPSYLNLLIKIQSGFANVAFFILLNNIISKHREQSDILLLIPVLSYCTICFLSANRGDILMLVIGGFFAAYILSGRKNNWAKKRSKATIRKSIKYGVIVLVLFWAFLFITGRDVNGGDRNIFTYLCSYISGPLASFDLYLKQGGLPVTRWGEETFVALNNNLNTLFHIGEVSQRYLEFRSAGGYSTTNIYSAFRRFYHDFGYTGVVCLSMLQGFVTTKLYRMVKKNHNRSTDVDFGLCFYCFFAYTIVYTLVDELFYSSNISISGIVKGVILFCCYKIYFYRSYQEITD